jgi:hypothetical protein
MMAILTGVRWNLSVVLMRQCNLMDCCHTHTEECGGVVLAWSSGIPLFMMEYILKDA